MDIGAYGGDEVIKLKTWLLKFNHGVEIGARLAYLGHYKATGDAKVLAIAQDELAHRLELELILKKMGSRSSKIIDGVFLIIGWCIHWLCQVSPNWLLNYIAMGLEMFAVISYTKCAKVFPLYASQFEEMALTENEHGEYFKGY